MNLCIWKPHVCRSKTAFLRDLTLPRIAGILKLSAMFALVVLSTQSFAQSSSVNPPIIREVAEW